MTKKTFLFQINVACSKWKQTKNQKEKKTRDSEIISPPKIISNSKLVDWEKDEWKDKSDETNT